MVIVAHDGRYVEFCLDLLLFVINILCEAKKTALYYFCNNFAETSVYQNNFWLTYTLINLEQNDIKIINFS